jgi:proteasome accessory factor B
MVQMVRESSETGYLANSGDFMKEFEVSRRTVARDLDYLRDEENAPLAYDEARHGYVLTDETYALPPVNISRKEAFSFGLARKLLAHYEGTTLHLDMKAVLDKIAESLEGEVTLEPEWLSEHVDVLPEDRVRIDPELWGRMAGFIEKRERICARYQTFDGRESDYRLHPYHLLAYHGNWYLLAYNEEKERMMWMKILM